MSKSVTESADVASQAREAYASSGDNGWLECAEVIEAWQEMERQWDMLSLVAMSHELTRHRDLAAELSCYFNSDPPPLLSRETDLYILLQDVTRS